MSALVTLGSKTKTIISKTIAVAELSKFTYISDVEKDRDIFHSLEKYLPDNGRHTGQPSGSLREMWIGFSPFTFFHLHVLMLKVCAAVLSVRCYADGAVLLGWYCDRCRM